jgi:hypothetical protein
MSGQIKKHRTRLGVQAINGKMTVNQARAQLGWQPLAEARPPAAVTKAAKPAAVKINEQYKVNEQHQALYDAGPAAMRLWHAGQVLAGAASEPRDPGLRENIRPGGGRPDAHTRRI